MNTPQWSALPAGLQLIIAYKILTLKEMENHIFLRQMIKHLNRNFSLS